MPGADGLIAMNSFVQRTKPDGLTLTMGSNTASDPLQYRRPQSQFDPRTFKFVGGLGRGGSILVIRTDAEKRLYNKALSAVVVGSIGGVPRSGMQAAAWGIAYLGWNAKWVVGYRGTKDLFVALERGEIDMTSTGNLAEVERLIDEGKVKVLAQSGALEDGTVSTRPGFGDVPVLATLLEGRISDPIEKLGYSYWANLTSIDKWLALPPGTSDSITSTYQRAYEQMVGDPDFIARGQRISEDILPQSAAEVTRIIGKLGATPSVAMEQVGIMLRKQGLEVR
jgi:tripartite-type tricarboxylate transporter receptor subunit TctC